MMDYTRLVSGLCAIIEQQNEIIQDQAVELAQHGAVERENEIRRLRSEYSEIMGEVPAP